MEGHMKPHIFLKAALRATLLIAMTLLVGCTHAPFTDRFNPETSEVTLWGSEAIPLEPGWRLIGVEKINLRGSIWNSFLVPIDEMQTMILVKGEEKEPSILLLSRVVKTGQTEIFTYLGGTKTIIGDRPYRENLYGLTSDTTDPEYRRYLEKVRASGLSPAPSYRVRVLDRLPHDSVLVRVMELTPDNMTSSLPSYGQMYPQEIQELIRRRFD